MLHVCHIAMLVQVWRVKLGPVGGAFSQARMQHLMQLCGSSTISFVQVGHPGEKHMCYAHGHYAVVLTMHNDSWSWR